MPTVVSVGHPTSLVTSSLEGLSRSLSHPVKSHPESEGSHGFAPPNSLRP